MTSITRRDFLRLTGAAGTTMALGPLVAPKRLLARTDSRVIVIGGGFGGATCANYISIFIPGIHVTLIEPNSHYVSCTFSNTVLGGIHDMEYITHSYESLKKNRGVHVIHDSANRIDPKTKQVILGSGATLPYDRLVVSPGIDFRWEEMRGCSDIFCESLPHAWQDGGQTVLLQKQLSAIPDGGVVLILPPSRPFKGPASPYERASLIAHYLKQHKPRSKLIILDSNPDFPKQELFQQAWQKLYPGMIEWVPVVGSDHLSRIDPKQQQVYTASGQTWKADVINAIPPQQAGAIARQTGLANDQGWCDVDQRTFESKLHKDIHVIGDACIAGDMPKTGHAASIQAKICAAAIGFSLNGGEMHEPLYSNSTYSLIGPMYGISSAAVYRLVDGRITRVSGGQSQMRASNRTRRREAKYAEGWYKATVSEMLAS